MRVWTKVDFCLRSEMAFTFTARSGLLENIFTHAERAQRLSENLTNLFFSFPGAPVNQLKNTTFLAAGDAGMKIAESLTKNCFAFNQMRSRAEPSKPGRGDGAAFKGDS